MTTSSAPQLGTRFHADAADFIFEALQHTQEMLGRSCQRGPQQDEEDAALEEEQVHITGVELLDGIRDLALERYGLMARWVFASWGIRTTEDFGRVVFDLVEQGKMRKTDQDRLSDFYAVYDFEQVLDRDYRCSTRLPSVK
jgi:uncharacterized repeat protein (TIGR04138 family)